VENPFDRLAQFYDWEHAAYLDDLPLYLGLAERVGGPILEAACGTGRLALPLAQSGYEVVGLDSSPEMLKVAEAKLVAEPELERQVRLQHGDLRTARLGQRFQLGIIALDSFGLLTDQADQLQVLDAMRSHLSDTGLLAIDVSNGNLRGGEPEEETVLHLAGETDDERGQLVKWVRRTTDHASQLDHLLHLYDESGIDGVVRRTSVELELRYFTRFELELLLDKAGFDIEALFGDYDLTPYGPGSHRLIATAHVRLPRSRP
jgi:SAM-dependent methyltransferase